MSKRLTHEFVYNIYKNEYYIMNSIYTNAHNKDQLICPVGHNIEMKFNKFQQGRRCGKCFGSKKYSHEYVFSYYSNENYIMKNIYKGMHYKDNLTCPVGHDIEIIFKNFKRGIRCNICYRENNFGVNHPSHNPNREEISLNKRLRKTFIKDWIIKNMKDDPNYNNFLNNPDEYVVDHIIPVKLFCQLFTKYNLYERDIKDIINQRNNLQLLTWEENCDKRSKGTLFEATNYLINNGVDITNFVEIHS